jgi:3-hydroxy-3-methylglutaryl CoA synthase
VEELSEADVRARFARLVAPSLRLAARIGPCHTAATYVNLASLLLHDAPKLGASIGVFSYGSGAASTMFRLRVRGNCRVGRGLVEGLDAREARRRPSRSRIRRCHRHRARTHAQRWRVGRGRCTAGPPSRS